MPLYEYACECSGERRVFSVRLSLSDYQDEVPCPCGSGMGKRVYSSPPVHKGMTAFEKKIGTTSTRREMADYMKDQREVRKKAYGSDTREGKSNEIWTGKEGLDGITSMPITRKSDQGQ